MLFCYVGFDTNVLKMREKWEKNKDQKTCVTGGIGGVLFVMIYAISIKLFRQLEPTRFFS